MISFYEIIYAMGRLSGCHQIPERSFRFRGKPFPVCARCTGVLIGYLIGGIGFIFYPLPIWVNIAFCAVMLADWLIQYLKIRQSTNLRRLLTGLLCGIGWFQLFLYAIIFLRDQLLHF